MSGAAVTQEAKEIVAKNIIATSPRKWKQQVAVLSSGAVIYVMDRAYRVSVYNGVICYYSPAQP